MSFFKKSPLIAKKMIIAKKMEHCENSDNNTVGLMSIYGTYHAFITYRKDPLPAVLLYQSVSKKISTF